MNEILGTEFGDVLTMLRKKSGLSQQQLAMRCGIHRTFVSMLERGMRLPSLQSFFILAHGLDIEPNELLTLVLQFNRLDSQDLT